MNVHTAPTGLRQPSTVKDSGDTLHREGVGDFLKSHHRPSVVVSENGWGAAGALARTTAPPQQRSSRQSIDHRGVAGEVALLVWWEGDAERGARGTPCFLRRAGRAWRCGPPPPPSTSPFSHRSASSCTLVHSRYLRGGRGGPRPAVQLARAPPGARATRLVGLPRHPPRLIFFPPPRPRCVRPRPHPRLVQLPDPCTASPDCFLLSPPPCPPSFRLAFIS